MNFVRAPQSERRRRIIAFAFAGGGASAFSRLRADLAQSAELVAVQLPGREERQEEVPLTDAERVLDLCLSDLALFDETPYALLGHSMGGRLAFHLAQRLAACGARPPSLVILSACVAPNSELPPVTGQRPIRTLSDAELLRHVEAYGGIPDELTLEQRSLVLPKLRADLRVLEDCSRLGTEPVDAPILILGGRADTTTPRRQLSRWAEFTRASAEIHLFAGGHFFLFDPPFPATPLIERAVCSACP